MGKRQKRIRVLSDRCISIAVEEGENPWNEERTYILINTATYNLFAIRESTVLELVKMVAEKRYKAKQEWPLLFTSMEAGKEN